MKIDWEKCAGLVPTIVQSQSGEVLMLAYMNEESLELTQKTGFAHYFSRSKGRIWKKGESSGHTQKVLEIKLDCDGDTLLLKVEQTGAACHTGQKSCFFNSLEFFASGPAGSEFSENSEFSGSQSAEFSTLKNLENSKPENSLNAPKYDILDRLYHACLQRRLDGDANTSYVAKLYEKGANAYLKKISEEGGEFVLAVKDLLSGAPGEHRAGHPEYDVIYEGADVLFHMIVALSALNIHPSRLLDELERREGLSGIDEKNSRSSKNGFKKEIYCNYCICHCNYSYYRCFFIRNI